jgi:hypothetical protein
VEQDTQSLSRHNASSEKRQFSSALMLAMQANYQLRFSRVIPKKLRRFILARTSKPVERYILNDEQKRYIAHRLADDYRKFSARFGCQTDCDNWTIKKWMHGAETSVGAVDSGIRSST